MREIYVIGGSNSLMKDGWVANLKKSRGDRLRVVNLSIGATTSLMGIFRMLRGDVPDGSTVVWEYALNESSYLMSGQTLTSLIHHLDWFMEIAHRKSVRILPLQFWTRLEHVTGQRNEYRKELQVRFSSYGLKQIDAWDPLCGLAAELSVDPHEMFSDRMHYSGETSFFPNIAEQVFSELDNAAVPKAAVTMDGRSLSLCAPREGGEIFKNSVITATAVPLVGDIHIEAQGQLLASFVITANDAAAATVTTDGNVLATYSSQAPIRVKQPGHLIKHWVHWSELRDKRNVQREIIVSGCRPEEVPVVQDSFAWRGASASERRMDAFLCSLLER